MIDTREIRDDIRWFLVVTAALLTLGTGYGCGGGGGATAPSPVTTVEPTPVLIDRNAPVDMEDFFVPTRHDAPVPWLRDGDMLYLWTWVRVENGVGTFTPNENYVMLELASDGVRLRRDKTWGTQMPGLYYEQNGRWALPSMRIGDHVTETRGKSFVFRLSDCGFEYSMPARSDNVLEDHRMQNIGSVWGEQEIVVMGNSYDEHFALARGLGMIGFKGLGHDWKWLNYRYVGAQPTPQGC